MTDVIVPVAPTLSRVPNVELVQTGIWHISTGVFTVTPDDLIAAVAALECPSVRRPALKFGHTGQFGKGQPSIGYIDNMAVTDDYRTVIGDYAGMPGWLGTVDAEGQSVLASAYPDRSVEAEHNFRCQMGHLHPFVIHAVSLLGEERPGVGTLQSLQDLAVLFGVEGAGDVTDDLPIAAAAPETSVTVRASEGTPMPEPVKKVAATVSADDVRRAFYESPIGSDWDAWIEEIQLDPLQVIYIDDDEGTRYRVPVVIDATGDGTDAVTFGEAVQVVIRYDDQTVAASAGTPDPIRFATKAESRPVAAGDPPAPAVPPVVPPTPKEADSMSDTVIKGLRERLGIADDAELDDDGLLARLDEQIAAATDPKPVPAPAAIPEGSVVVDSDVLEELRVAASAGMEARKIQLRADRDNTIAAAVSGGHIAPARKDHWTAKWDKDPEGVAASIAELTKSDPIFPVEASGYSGGDDASDPADGDNYWFPGAGTATTPKEA